MATPRLVQSSYTDGTSVTLTGVTAGSLIFVTAAQYNSTFTPSISSGTLVTASPVTAYGTTDYVYAGYVVNSVGGTVTFSTTSACELIIAEYAGVSTSSPLLNSPTYSSAYSSSVTTPSATPIAGTLAIVHIVSASPATDTFTYNNGFVQDSKVKGTPYTVALANKVVSNTSSISCTVGGTGGPNQLTASVFLFAPDTIGYVTRIFTDYYSSGATYSSGSPTTTGTFDSKAGDILVVAVTSAAVGSPSSASCTDGSLAAGTLLQYDGSREFSRIFYRKITADRTADSVTVNWSASTNQRVIYTMLYRPGSGYSLAFDQEVAGPVSVFTTSSTTSAYTIGGAGVAIGFVAMDYNTIGTTTTIGSSFSKFSTEVAGTAFISDKYPTGALTSQTTTATASVNEYINIHVMSFLATFSGVKPYVGQSTSITASGSYGASSYGGLITPAVDTNPTGSSFLIFTTNGQYYNGSVGNYIISDNKGNQYTLLGVSNDTVNGGYMSAYLCVNGIGGTGHTANIAPVTTLNSGTSYFIEIIGANRRSLIETVASNGTFYSATVYNAANINFGSASVTATKPSLIIGVPTFSAANAAAGWDYIRFPAISYQARIAGTYSPTYIAAGSAASGAQLLLAFYPEVIRQYANGAFLSSQFIEGAI